MNGLFRLNFVFSFSAPTDLFLSENQKHGAEKKRCPNRPDVELLWCTHLFSHWLALFIEKLQFVVLPTVHVSNCHCVAFQLSKRKLFIMLQK
jgi:hypothetical protein